MIESSPVTMTNVVLLFSDGNHAPSTVHGAIAAFRVSVGVDKDWMGLNASGWMCWGQAHPSDND